MAGHGGVGQGNRIAGHREVRLVLGATPPEAAWGAQSLADVHAPEGVDEGPPEAGVHEAVGDGVAAGRGVGQQLQEADGRVAHVLVHHRPEQHRHRVDHVQGRPADEELQDEDEQHLHHSLLALQALAFVRATRHNAASYPR